MKYELGDKVRINHYWKRQNQTEQLEKMGITELEDHLMKWPEIPYTLIN